jgi:hypothetical protein
VDFAVRWFVELAALNAVDGELAVADDGHIVVFEEDDLVGVLDDGARVRREEVLDVFVGAERGEFGFGCAVWSGCWGLNY